MNGQDNLIQKVAEPENLLTAWRSVRGNIPQYRRQRSAGPDGISISEFELDLTAQLNILRDLLLKDRYYPQTPGLITIPKTNGGTRQIAVLNVVDRVAQRATQQVIEPIFEPCFLPCSFGYRPGRSIQDAVYCVRRMRERGYRWVVDGDIASCFDSLDHQLLIREIEKRISDKKMLSILQKWLNVGILEHGVPDDRLVLAAERFKTASKSIRSGIDWALSTLTHRDLYDPYSESRFQSSFFAKQSDGVFKKHTLNEEDFGFEYDSITSKDEALIPGSDPIQQHIFQQLAVGGLFLASNWTCSTLSKIGPTILATLKGTAGREILKRGLLISGGTLGAAAGLTLSAYFINRQFVPATVGVLQGSPLSPLLANIYLNTFDQTITQSGFKMVRFADDWVILCPDEQFAESAYDQAVIALTEIQLKINRTKTRILSPSDRLEWLGEVIL